MGPHIAECGESKGQGGHAVYMTLCRLPTTTTTTTTLGDDRLAGLMKSKNLRICGCIRMHTYEALRGVRDSDAA